MEEEKKIGRPKTKVAPTKKRPRGRPRKTEAVEPKEKRPRGRPRKESPEQENAVKRARGRPRKYPKKDESAEKRPRGRPRKTDKVEPSVKRPRGRPRKEVVTADKVVAEGLHPYINAEPKYIETFEPSVETAPPLVLREGVETASEAVIKHGHPFSEADFESAEVEVPEKATLAPAVDFENEELEDMLEGIEPLESSPDLAQNSLDKSQATDLLSASPTGASDVFEASDIQTTGSAVDSEQNTANIDVRGDVTQDADDESLEPGEGYRRLKERAASIILNKAQVKPAKHMADNILHEDRPLPPIIATPPLVKMNISTPKTPLKKAEKPVNKMILKANPMPNMVIVITGATSGMGFAMAKKLAGLGHIVLAIGRKPGLCRDARDEILDEYPDANIHYLVADLSLMSQVRILAEEIREKVFSLRRECIDCIIHNAAEDLEEHKLTYENREYMWATNYLSVVLLTRLLQPLLDASRNAKVITMTTRRASRKTKINWKYLRDRSGKFVSKIYEQTKLADLMFALEYDHQYADRDDIHAYCVDPGNVNTTLRTRNASGIRRCHFDFWRKKGKPIEDGIKTAIYLTLAKTLPSHTVLYRNMSAVEPSKFALAQDNRTALMRVTEMELRDDSDLKIK